MLDSIRKRVPELLRRARREAVELAWRGNWRAVRAIATPWVRKEAAAARDTLRTAARRDASIDSPGSAGARSVAEGRRGVSIDRGQLDGWVRAAAPPDIPYEAVVLPGPELAARFADDGPKERRSLHLIGKVRMTHRDVPSPSVLVIVLFSDVAADYFVESMAADIANEVNAAHGDGAAIADAQAGIPVVLKEFATAAGLGVIGKNALFHSHRFGFNCKLSVVFLNAPVTRYDAMPTNTAWKLPDCSTCNLCVEACPVGAFDDYRMKNAQACDRLIAADYFGPRRDHMCRACITRCPVSNDILKLRRSEGVPARLFWDNEAQLSLAADLFMYRPSFWVWLLQRFYYGAEMPGRPARSKKGFGDALTSSINVATTERTRDGWRIAARKPRDRR